MSIGLVIILACVVVLLLVAAREKTVHNRRKNPLLDLMPEEEWRELEKDALESL